MPQVRRPRRGSMAYWPKKRAKRSYPKIHHWPVSTEIKPLGFAGYKTGMTHILMVETNTNSRVKGLELQKTVTIMDCPPVSVFGFRAYTKNNYSLSAFGDVLAEKPNKNLARKMNNKKNSYAESLKKMEEKIDKIFKFVLLCHTNPGFKKTPEVFEVEIGGDSKKQFEFCKNMIGKDFSISDVFKEGEYVDAIAVTKGKGYQGSVKRFGIKLQGRKDEQAHRHIGASGSKEPGRIRPTVPQAGQLGFQTRTELNKRILKFAKIEEVTPENGFKNYGKIYGQAVLIEGSMPGSTKRLIRFRFPIRPSNKKYPIDIRYISTRSKQGV